MTDLDNFLSLRDATSEQAKRRLLLFVDALGATAHISFLRPYSRLRTSGEIAIAVVAESDLDKKTQLESRQALEGLWKTFKPQACVISRQASRNLPEILRCAQSAQTPLVVHLDDDLFSVPEELGTGKAARHNRPERLSRLKLACQRADWIYASTQVLGDRLQSRFPMKSVLAGSIYCSAEPPFEPFKTDSPKVFGYMGTKGHAADLETITPAIAAILESEPDAAFEILGMPPPPSLAAFGDRVRQRPSVSDYDQFLGVMRTLGWKAGLAPVNDTPFNRCKADTKFVEYAQAGIPAICAAASGVYKRPISVGAALSADSHAEWTAEVLSLLREPQRCRTLITRAQTLLIEQYSDHMLESQLERLFFT